MSDSTLDSGARHVDPASLHDHWVSQVRALHRKNRLTPDTLPCGGATVDGTPVATLTHRAEGTAQQRHEKDGRPSWLARALRSTLTSAASKPCLAHMPRPVGTNERGGGLEFIERLHTWSGRSQLCELLDVDAGCCSLEQATHVNGLDDGSLWALKDTQPEGLAEATRVLLPLAHQTRVDAETP